MESAYAWVDHLLPPTVSLLEVVWTLPAAVGMTRYIGRYIRNGRGQRALEKEQVHGAYKLMGDMRALRFLGLAIVFELFLLLGLVAMTIPQNPASNEYSTTAFFSTALLLLAEVALVLIGEAADWYQAQIDRLLRVDPDVRVCPYCGRNYEEGDIACA